MAIDEPTVDPCRHCQCDIEGHAVFDGRIYVHLCDHDHTHPPEPDNRLGAKI